MAQVHNPGTAHISRVLVVCDNPDTGAVWEYILRQHSIVGVLVSSVQKALDAWTSEIPDVVVIDLDDAKDSDMELCRQFREVSVVPIILLLPAHHETKILEAYAAGVDEVVIEPISPAIFLAKTVVWVRRSWTVPVEGLSHVNAGKYRLDPARRSLIGADGTANKLTNLEFRLLLLLMSRPGHAFGADEIVRSIWGGYGSGDHVMLKNVVYRLRRKIEPEPSHPLLLQTGQGGYSFQG